MQEVASGLRPAIPAYGVVSIETAEENPPPPPTRAMQRRRHPTEVGRVTHRSIQGDKEPLKLSEVVAVIIANIFDVDIASLPLDSIDVRGFIGITAIRHGAVEAGAGDTGEGDKALVPFCVSAGGEDGDR